jgi:polyhydroxybutyrate depolymerase
MLSQCTLPLLALLSLASCAPPEERAPGRYVDNLLVAGTDRSFVLRIPEKAKEKTPLPLVIYLHGWTATAAASEAYTNLPALGESEGFILAIPEGLGKPQGWNVGWIDLSGKKQDEAPFISAVLDQTMKVTKVDPNRVYVCGHSNGGFLSYYLATKMPERFAAVGIMAGAIGMAPPNGERKMLEQPKAKVPSTIILHGMADPTVTYKPDNKGVLKAISIEEGAETWAKWAGITSPAISTELGDAIKVWDWKSEDREVRLIASVNGDHSWFGQPGESKSGLNAAKIMWDFFKTKTLTP